MMTKGGTVTGRKAIVRSALGMALALALGACVSLGGGGKPPAMLLSLSAAESAPAGATASGKVGDALLVLEPEADQRLAVNRVPVLMGGGQVAYLTDAAWVERPARLFARLLADTLRARGARPVLEEGQSAGAPGIRLSGRLSEMSYDVAGQAVVVRFDALRSGPEGQIITRRFEAVVPGVGGKAEQIGPALNRAANDVARQVADWMGG